MSSIWEKGNKKILVAGHRGACALYPENTMLSFKKAVEMGVDGLETDVWMSRDGVLMLMHDDSLARTTDAAAGGIPDYTYKELRAFDAGAKFSPAYAGEKIPTLEEFLEFVKDQNLMLNIEIKDCRHEVVDKTVRLLSAKNIGDTFLINSWDGDITTYAYEKYGVKTHGYPREYYKAYKPVFHKGMYSVGIHMKDLTEERCMEYRAMGIEPWCWCPDTAEEVEFAVSCGAVLATVNDPRAAIQVNGG